MSDRLKILKKQICILLAGVMMICVTSCNKDAQIPQMPESMGEINCISREKGSGTRDVFESALNSKADGTKNVAGSNTEMEQLISDDENAIGYNAYFTTELSDNTKFISVNGVQVNNETIKNGKYPLTRNYYLCYNGKLTDAQNDFLKYIMGAGQEIVEKEAIKVHKTTSFLSDKSKGTIKICGSTSVAPLIKELAEGYKKYNPDVKIEITKTDSTAGITSAIRNECDFAMSSRELESYEEELLTKKSIAKDAIAVTVNKNNPIDNLSINQLKEIYDGEFKNWNDVK